MGKSKLQRFRELAQFENVLELTDFQAKRTEKPKGKWRTGIFGNRHPITLELACGKGDYTLELARRDPSRNFVGIDIKGSRLWKGARRALDENLGNVRFLRIYIDHLEEYFAASETDEIWITFPDPYPRGSDRNKRLTSPKFLTLYRHILGEEGAIHLKTDSTPLFDYTLESVKEFGCRIRRILKDVHGEVPGDDLLAIKTDFERKHLEKGKKIKYLKFTLPPG